MTPEQKSRAERLSTILTALYSRLFANCPETPGTSCKLGQEPSKRRGQSCSVCNIKTEFEFDRAVAELIAKKIFRSTIVCPYIVVTSSLVGGILFSPAVELSSRANELTRIEELSTAMKHIDRAIRTLARNRSDTRALKDQDPYFERWADVFDAEQLISSALIYFRENYQKFYLRPTPTRGRKGELELQGVTRAMVRAWKTLTGTLPGKNNTHFHELLRAAATTAFGPLEPEPDFEWATRSARRAMEKGR